MYHALLIFLLFLFAATAHAEISANFKAGAVVIGPADDGECVPAVEGALRWSSADKTHHMCDGTGWKKIIATTGVGDPSTPPAGTGYFVMSAGSWSGHLGNIAGADSKCLTDLTDNDWLNKADAVSRGLLNSTKVRAFLCDNNTCINAVSGATYTFAVSGAPTIGGASFNIDMAGQGPGNTQIWSGTNYFGTAAEYWAGRATGSADLWPLNPGSSAHCSNWSQSSGYTGIYGLANTANAGRWNFSSMSCAAVKKLICLVHP